MDEPAVVLDKVSRYYRRSGAGVSCLDLRLERGVCYGLLGRNGSGKTTTLRLVMGMLRPKAGTVRVFGHDPFTDPERARARVGHLAEDQELPAVLRPVDLFRAFRSFHPGWDDAFAKELSDRFSISLGRRLSEMSRGQKRQVALVCAVAHRPELLVLDEPGGGLDPVVRRSFLEAVIDLLGTGGTTVLLSSHNLPEVERVADRIGILCGGALILDRDLAALKEGSCRALVEGDGVQKKSVEGCVRVRTVEGTTTLTLLCSPDEARRRLRDTLGKEAVQVQSVSLEDLFVDLVGDES